MKRTIDITLTDAAGEQFRFESLGQLHDFCQKELRFWNEASKSIGEGLTLNQNYTKANYFQATVNTIESWKDSEPTWDESAFNNNFAQLRSQHINQLSGDWVWHGHPFIKRWIDLYKKGQVTADSFLLAVLRRPIHEMVNSVEHLTGVIPELFKVVVA